MFVHDVLKYDIMHIHNIYNAFCIKRECRLSLTNYNDSENEICLIYVGGCRENSYYIFLLSSFRVTIKYFWEQMSC